MSSSQQAREERLRPNLSAIQSELDEIAVEMDRVKDQRPKRTMSLTKNDVLDALRETNSLLTNADADEASRFARGPITRHEGLPDNPPAPVPPVPPAA